MNTQRNTPSRSTPSNTQRSGGSEAGGQQEGLRHPIDDVQRVKQRLDDVGLDDRDDVADDQLRDRRGSGDGRAGKEAG
jgi:hypothetical protein